MAIKLIYPVNGPITQYFGENPDFYKQWGYAGHNGIDFGIPNGTPIVAAADGVVEKTGFELGGYGNFVKMVHTADATKFVTYYAHLQSTSVSAGQQIKAGTVVGLSNNTGASSGPHLHFGVRIDGQNPAFLGYVDPLPLFTGGAAPAVPGAAASAPSLSRPGVAQNIAASAGALAGAVALPGLDLEVVTPNGVNVRSGPGAEYGILEQLNVGTKVKGTRLYSTSAWVELQPGKWCALTFNSTALVTVVGRSSLINQPVSNTAGALRLPSLDLQTTDYLRVRSGPGPENAEVAPMFNPGDKFVVNQIFAVRAWIEIGKDRWAALIFDGIQLLKFL